MVSIYGLTAKRARYGCVAGEVGERSSFRRINSGILLLEYQLHHIQFDSIFQSLTIDFDSLPSFATPDPANKLPLGYRPWPSFSKASYYPTILNAVAGPIKKVQCLNEKRQTSKLFHPETCASTTNTGSSAVTGSGATSDSTAPRSTESARRVV